MEQTREDRPCDATQLKTKDGATMSPPLECASCTEEATSIIVVRDLFQMVVPICEACRAADAPTLESYLISSPEGQDVLVTHTVLRGWFVPRY